MNQRLFHLPATRGTLLLLTATLATFGCAPYEPKIDVVENPAQQVSTFRTWNFVDPMTVETTGYPEAVISGFERSIEQALEARGYERGNEPQLLVNVAAAIADEGDAALNTDAYQAIHAQRGTFHDSWRGYGEGYGASTRQQRFGDGSISIGLIATGTNTLVWESVATGRLSGQRSEDAMVELVETVARQMMEDLPPRQ